jgi:hypothetical protein
MFTIEKTRTEGAQNEIDFLKNRYKDMVQQTSSIVGVDLLKKWNY